MLSLEPSRFRGAAFGLQFDAPIPLPELGELHAPALSVRVQLSQVADVQPGWTGTVPRLSYGHADGVRITADRECIQVDYAARAPEELVRLLILGAGVCMTLVAQGCGVLHATTVRIDGRDVAICGPSGVGKSSFTSALLARGGTLVADDLCVLDPTMQPFAVRPGLPRLKLWDDTARHFGQDPSALARVHPGFDKRSVPQDVVVDPAPLADVLVLQRGPAGFATLSGAEAVTALLANHRLPEVLDPVQQGRWLQLVARLASAIPVQRVSLPGDLGALEHAADAWLQRR